MSFILDALRKSEHDRQREKGPGLAEVAVAPPKPKKNVWASIAVALLVVNLVAIGVLLIRRGGKSDSQAAVPASAAPASAATAPLTNTESVAAGSSTSAPPASSAPPPVPAPSDGTYPSRAIPGTVPPVLQPALPADGGSSNPLAAELTDADAAAAGYDPGYDNGAGYAAGGYPNAPPGGAPQKRGSVVYETLPEADPITSPSNAAAQAQARVDRAMEYPQPQYPPQQYPQQQYPQQPYPQPKYPAPGSVSRAVPVPGGVTPQVSEAPSSTLPDAEDIASQSGLPDLHLDVHVYSTKPSERFAFINSRKYKEGDTLQEGPHIDRITPDAVELSYHGSRFQLSRQ